MSSPKVTFLILVNSKSGGQDGSQLLEKFTEIFQEVEYQNRKEVFMWMKLTSFYI